MAPLTQMPLRADPARVLWGSDWPRPAHRDQPPDETQRRIILVEKPVALYGS